MLENMEINYIHENPKAVLRQEHAATMRLQLEETLGTFNGFFFVTLFLNEAVQRLTFGYVTRSTSFNDVRFRLHILQPYAEGGQPPSNYFNYHTFLMPQQVCYSRNCACPLLHTQLVEYFQKSWPYVSQKPQQEIECTLLVRLTNLVLLVTQSSRLREVMKIKSCQSTNLCGWSSTLPTLFRAVLLLVVSLPCFM